MMNLPGTGDYIDIHTHGAKPVHGLFSVEVLMAHEERIPEKTPGIAFTYGIHHWYLDPVKITIRDLAGIFRENLLSGKTF